MKRVTFLIVAIQALCLVRCDEEGGLNNAGRRKREHLQPIQSPEAALNEQLDASGLYTALEDPKLIEGLHRHAPVCVPAFHLPTSRSDNQSTDGAAFGLDEFQTNFSFGINDIDMPVSPPNGGVNSAIKLLATFDSQLSDSDEVEAEENVVKFRQNQLKIEGLNLTKLNVYLYTDSDPRFGVGIKIKKTTLTGQFSYKAPLILTGSKLSGFYRMSIDNVYLTATSNLTKRTAASHQSSYLDLDLSYPRLETNDLKLNISDLGYISIDIMDSKDSQKSTSNYLLKMLQRVLQKSIKKTYYSFEQYIRQTLQSEAKKAIDCELTRFSHLLDDSPVDQRDLMAKIINAEISNSKLNHAMLPDFEHQQDVLRTSANIKFYNGSLDGLNSVRLNGETRIKLQDNHLFVNTSVGWSELKPYYSWSLFVSPSRFIPRESDDKAPLARGHVQFYIKNIDFDSVITKGLKPNSEIVVEKLEIKRLDNPKMDISGLPGLNRVTKGVVNFFMGRLKQRVAHSIQPALKQQLEKALNRVKF